MDGEENQNNLDNSQSKNDILKLSIRSDVAQSADRLRLGIVPISLSARSEEGIKNMINESGVSLITKKLP